MKEIIPLKAFLLLLFGFSLSIIVSAQSAQAFSNDDLKAMMANDWVRAKAYTLEYLNTMPANKYSFKAVDTTRSFAQQMLHLAMANVYLMSTATDQKPLPW